ncbi:MAG TPA: heme biosynthesis HemY N-terminal domain-containing protein [Burkholderiales bacterium]|nr:heme biosynthesis HemY N-terminal domain-containing protein [Burkholderiales bacterium]
MKTLFTIIALFAIAVGLVLAARYNDGYVLVMLPPYRVEFSLNFLLVLLAIAFVLLYSFARLVTTAVQTPARVRQYRLARRRASAQAALLTALEAYFEGRYAKAERAAAHSAELGQNKRLSLVVAARAAHELRSFDRRDAYLREAAIEAPDEDALRIVTEAELLLEERRAQEALDVLKGLPRKHTAALKLELKAQQQTRRWEEVAALASELEKRNVFDADQGAKLRVTAVAESLKRKAHDAIALDEAWKKVPDVQKRDATIAAAVARCYIDLGRGTDALAVVEQSLGTAWDSRLAALYAEAIGRDPVRQLERAEKWLEEHRNDSQLLLALGKLCARQSLWGKAESYLEASVAVEPTVAGHLELARLQDRLGNADAARRHYRESLELALKALNP